MITLKTTTKLKDLERCLVCKGTQKGVCTFVKSVQKEEQQFDF